MKIQLTYKEPNTNIKAYIYNTYYDETEVKEALEERAAALRAGYELVHWRLLHDEDAVE